MTDDLNQSPDTLPVLIVESHLAHYLCDLSVVLRTHPHTLKDRLDKRGYSDRKVMENILAESIDIVLCDCFDYCRRVYEINTTDMNIHETANCLKELIHALYEDELKVYENLMSKIEEITDDFEVSRAMTAEMPISDVLYSYEDEGAVIYDGNDEVDYVEETHPVLAKYIPGKNDWSESVD